MTDAFLALRKLNIYATSQTLPSGFRITLSSRERTCWGVGHTLEAALEAALKEWTRKYGTLQNLPSLVR